MINLNYLQESIPKELFGLLSSCSTEADLISKLEKDRSRLLFMLQHLKIVGNEALSARLFFKVSFCDLNRPEIKRIETILRNCGMLKGICAPDFSLKGEGGDVSISSHYAVLSLESSYFQAMKEFKEFKQNKLEMKEMGILPPVYQLVIDYLYLSDEKRKEYLSTVDKTLIIDIARLADYWKMDKLKEYCDEELCTCLADFEIEKSDLSNWLVHSDLFPKFSSLLKFINRIARGSDLKPIIKDIGTSERALQLAMQCTKEEMVLFATPKTEFGKACYVTLGAFFGKSEWEKAFPITIVEVPPLPPHIYEILDQEDPYDPSKKMKETCLLFLRPQKVILHEETADKELMLGFNEFEELAMKVPNPIQRMRYETYSEFRNQMKRVAVEPTAWVLMRKMVIPGSRNKSFYAQKQLLKGCFEVPKMMDAILLNTIIYVSQGICLYGRRPWTYTRCQEKFNDNQRIVGGFAPGYRWTFEPSQLYIYSDYFDDRSIGLSCTWKFKEEV